MTTYSDSDEITGNEIIDGALELEDEVTQDELVEEIGEKADPEDEADNFAVTKDAIADLEEEIGGLKEDDEVAVNGEHNAIGHELEKDEERLQQAKSALEDEEAGFVGE